MIGFLALWTHSNSVLAQVGMVAGLASLNGLRAFHPLVEEEEYFFLKTIIPSRKATRDYLQEGEVDAED